MKGWGGAGNRSRTYDLRITNALLYQLSYSGEGAEYTDSNPGLEPLDGTANLHARTASSNLRRVPLALQSRHSL